MKRRELFKLTAATVAVSAVAAVEAKDAPPAEFIPDVLAVLNEDTVLSGIVRLKPAYMIVYDDQDQPLYRATLTPQPALTLCPGESLTIMSTLTIV